MAGRCTLLLGNLRARRPGKEESHRHAPRTTARSLTSSPTWKGLHGWLREAIQKLLQAALEAEVTELLGRVRYQRRATVDGPAGSSGGYRTPQKLLTPVGTVTLRRPRVRGLEE